MAFDTLIFDPSASDTLVLDAGGVDWLVLEAYVAEAIDFAAVYQSISGSCNRHALLCGASSGYTLAGKPLPPIVVLSGTYDGLLLAMGADDRYGLATGAFDGFTLIVGPNWEQVLSVDGSQAIEGSTNQLTEV